MSIDELHNVNGYFVCILYVYGYFYLCYNSVGGDNVAVSEAHSRASVKYNKARDNIMIRPSKEDGAEIRQAAADAGQSVQNYILQACSERMQRENHDKPKNT